MNEKATCTLCGHPMPAGEEMFKFHGYSCECPSPPVSKTATMRDLMIDIETLGTAPGSVILSIGAVAFDAVTGEFGEEFYAAIDPQYAVAAGLTTDISTVKWWMTQSDDARRAAFGGDRLLGATLSEFGDYVRRINATRVWAKPPSFDLVLLEAAFQATGISIPWHYRTPRDVRTLLDISGTTAQTGVGVAHNALDDAKSQAVDVINAVRVMAERTAPAANGGHTDG